MTASTSKPVGSSLSHKVSTGRPAWASPNARLNPLSTSSRGSKAPRDTSGREAANAAMRRAQQQEPHGHNPGVRTLVRNSRLPGDSLGYGGRGTHPQMTTYVSLEQLKARAPSGNTNLHSLNSLPHHQQPPHALLPLHNARTGKCIPAPTHVLRNGWLQYAPVCVDGQRAQCRGSRSRAHTQLPPALHRLCCPHERTHPTSAHHLTKYTRRSILQESSLRSCARG